MRDTYIIEKKIGNNELQRFLFIIIKNRKDIFKKLKIENIHLFIFRIK